MEKREINKINLEDTAEYNEVRKMNNHVFRSMFQEELSKNNIRFGEEYIEEEFENLLKKTRNLSNDTKIIKNSLVKLNEEQDMKTENLLESLKKTNSENLDELTKIKHQIEELKTDLLHDDEQKLLLYENNFKESLSNQSNIKELYGDIDSKISTLIEEAKGTNYKSSKLLNQIIDDQRTSEGKLRENITKENEKIKNTFSHELKEVKENTIKSLEESSLLKNRISTLEESQNNNFNLLRQEDGLVQLTNFKEENDIQIHSLKKSIIWLMTGNILLAVTIIILLILVLF